MQPTDLPGCRSLHSLRAAMPVSNRAAHTPGTQTQAVTVSRESLGPCGCHLNFTVEEVKTRSGWLSTRWSV